ncbi:MAG: hypothetical protein IIC10_00720 [Proteobacteria bacterium]|nr:hypothetical protein [Pseudomonadota bacterium]
MDANTADLIYALVGIRLKSTHLAATVNLESFSVLAETNDDFEWLVIFNPTVADTKDNFAQDTSPESNPSTRT